MANTSSRPVENCQICGSADLSSILFLGYMPPVNTMPDVGRVAVEEAAYPLELMRCGSCGLVQIGLEVSQQVLFPESYPYLSGSTRILRTNFAELEREATALLDLKKDGLVIDIGSSDGTLLSNFMDAGYPVLGIEPSQAADVGISRGVETLKDYFNREFARKLAAERGQAQLVTAANVFAHIGDIHSVVDGIIELLAPGGVFVSESHYLLDLIETLQYDTIYHEHLRYYSLGSLKHLLSAHDLEVFHVKPIGTHGGSIRVYSARKGEREVQSSVAEQLAKEDEAGVTDGSGLANFRERVAGSKLALCELLAPLKRDGARIYGVGAPSRASTLVNYVGIDDHAVDAVMEISTSHKLNKYIPGTRIPVLDEKMLYEDQPDYALLLSWHIADELIENLRKRGYRGKFITPLPEPRIVDA